MKLGFISDSHGNIFGLRAALETLKREGAEAVYCLGDITGYGPDPDECIDLVRSECSIVLKGNHDHAVIFKDEARLFNTNAQQAVIWTQDYLLSKLDNGPGLLNYLNSLSPVHEEGDLLLVHGSPRDPLDEYVEQKSVGSRHFMEPLFDPVKRGCFHGHTHIPGVILEQSYGYTFQSPGDVGGSIQIPEGMKFLVNVGSCGQPRDRDARACCCMFDTDTNTVEWHRTDYDIEEVIRRIEAVTELDNWLGERLREGK